MNQPILGNLHPLIKSIAERNTPALSFLNPQFSDYAEWRRLAHAKATELLRYAPPAVPLDTQVIETTDKGDYIREKITFASAPGMRVPAYVLSPKGMSKPAPGIVALHDHGGYYLHGKEKLVEIEKEPAHLIEHRASAYGGRAYTTELVKRGYVVVAIDAFYWGERRLDFQQMPPELVKEMQRRSQFKTGPQGTNSVLSLLEELTMRYITAAGATWLGIINHDDRATVSYLQSRPDVDPERIGCVGLSMGGTRTDWLFGMDERVKAAVSAGWGTDWSLLMDEYVGRHSWTQYAPGLAGNLELSDVMAMGMPGAFMIQQCAKDDLFPLEGMQKTSERVRALYEKAGLGERYSTKFYDVPHQFNVQMQADAFDWLDKWLK